MSEWIKYNNSIFKCDCCGSVGKSVWKIKGATRLDTDSKVYFCDKCKEHFGSNHCDLKS
jgi:hypothetical protein